MDSLLVLFDTLKGLEHLVAVCELVLTVLDWHCLLEKFRASIQ